MPRALDPLLAAAFDSGSFDPIIKVLYWTDATHSLECQVIRYKQETTHLTVDFYLPDNRLADGDTIISLVRGLRIAGAEYTVQSAKYHARVVSQTKTLVHFDGTIAKPSPYRWDASINYYSILQSYFDTPEVNGDITIAVRGDPVEMPWALYKYGPAQTLLSYRNPDDYHADLRRRQGIFAADNANGEILYTSVDDLTNLLVPGNSTDPDHAITATLLDTVSLRMIDINYIWQDELGRDWRGTDLFAEAQHDIGYRQSDNDVPTPTSWPTGILITLPIHLKYLTGDSVALTLPDGSVQVIQVLVTEIFDSTKYPAWYVTIKPVPFVSNEEDGPDTSQYNSDETLTDPANWTLKIDWNNDGSWSESVELESIYSLHLVRGRRERMAAGGLVQPDAEKITIKMFDPNARYDRFNPDSPIYTYIGRAGIPLQVLISTNIYTTPIPVFTGTLDNIVYNVSTGSATITGSGLSKYLEANAAQELWTPCQPVTGGHDAYFVDDGSTPFPVNYWKGRTNALPLRECVALTLARAAWPFGAEYGSEVFNNEQPNYFFWHGTTAWAALKELAEGFIASLFFLRDGSLYTMDRLDTIGLVPYAPPLVGIKQSAGLIYPFPYDSLRNSMRVSVRQHEVTPFKSPYIADYYLTAWSNSGPVIVAPSTTVDIDVEYPSGIDRPIQGSFVDVNGSGYPVNFECWSAADKTGTNMAASGTGQGEFAILWDTISGLVYPKGNNQKWVKVRFKNYSASLTAHFFNCRVMLIGIRETGNPTVIKATDATSITANGERTFVLSNRWIQTTALATSMASAYLAALSSRLQATPATIAYLSRRSSIYDIINTYDLGTYINFGPAGETLADTNFGIYGRWIIVGEEITWLTHNGQEAEFKYTYEKSTAVDIVPVVHERSNGATSTTASVVVSHQTDSHNDRFLLLMVSLRAYQTVTSATYGAQSFTFVSAVQAASGNNPRVELWKLVAPTVGTANVTVNLSGADFTEIAVLGLYHVNQSSPLRTAATGSGLTGTPSVSATSVAGDFVADAIGYAGADATKGADQTLLGTISSDGNWKLSASKRAGLATTTPMTWTRASAPWAQIAVAVKSISEA